MYGEEHKKPLPFKIQMLKFIAQQGIVSIEDINRHFYPDRDNSRAIRVTLYDMGVGHLRYYSPDVKNGVWYIKDLKHYQYLSFWDPEFSYFKVQKPLVHLSPHYLEINHLRTVIEQDAGLVIKQWLSETWLRSLPPDLRRYYCSAKIPDAIFYKTNKDGSEKKYFLEYERSLKNSERYVEIFRSYSKREDVTDGSVLYICHTPHLRNKLIGVMKRESRVGVLDCDSDYFQFLSLEGFYQWGAEEKAKKKDLDSKPEVKSEAQAEVTQTA